MPPAAASDDQRHQKLLSKLAPLGQQHVLARWSQLNPAQQDRLAAQIADFDPALFQSLQQAFRNEQSAGQTDRAHYAALATRATPPPAISLGGSGAGFSPEDARRRGEQLLRAGQIAMILVAGGLGTRLGFDQPKGMFPLGPLSGRTLFQIILEQLLAAQRRSGALIPLYVMTSPSTDSVTREFLDGHDWFGIAPTDRRVFCQSTMWAVDDRFEKLLMSAPDSLFLGPDGHGGMLSALAKSGSLADAQSRGVQHFFYGQIDNPLLQVCDPLLLGSHALAHSEMTTQVVRKRRPLEKVGNVVSVDGRVHVIEYSDLPAEVAEQTNPDGSLKLWAGNLAVHVFDAAFLSRCANEPGALPFHQAHKKVTCLDAAGNEVEPAEPNAIRFERFIFDLLPLASRALVVEADPAEAFAPVKNANTDLTDNPRTAQEAMIALARKQLRAAGIQIDDDTSIEINPLFASTPEELRQRLPPNATIDKITYLAPTDQ